MFLPLLPCFLGRNRKLGSHRTTRRRNRPGSHALRRARLVVVGTCAHPSALLQTPMIALHVTMMISVVLLLVNSRPLTLRLLPVLARHRSQLLTALVLALALLPLIRRTPPNVADSPFGVSEAPSREPLSSGSGDLMIGGRLLQYAKAWRRVTRSKMVLSTVTSGFRIPFRRTPQQLRYRSRPHTQEQATVIDKEVKELLAKRATRLVTDDMLAEHPGFVSHLFAVSKKSGGWRPVLDLSRLNRFIRKKHFQMESIKHIRHMIRKGDWFVSIDLKDAFLHVPMDPRFFKWLRFRWNGQLYEFTTLPFGLTSSPWVFTKVLREVVAFLRSRGIRLAIYLDDMLIMGSSYQEALSALHECRSLLEQLGFTLNLDKSVMEPAQRI